MVTSDAYLKLAETHAALVDGPLYDQGATNEAISYFEDYLILFPRVRAWPRPKTGWPR